MPNRKTHAVAGTAAGIFVSIYEYHEIKKVNPDAQFDLSKLAINILAGLNSVNSGVNSGSTLLNFRV